MCLAPQSSRSRTASKGENLGSESICILGISIPAVHRYIRAVTFACV